MKAWLAWVAVAFFSVPAAYASPDNAAPHTAWQPDRGFAKVVKIGFEAANHGVTVTEDVCVRPAAAAVTVGVAQEDCLVVAAGPKGPLCFELVWQNGASGTRYSCALVKKAIRRDTRRSWVVRYQRRFLA